MSDELRFLHVFSTFAVGGPQVRFAQIANRIAQEDGRAIEHVIIAMDGRYDALAKLDPDVRYRQADVPGGGGLIGRVLGYRKALELHAPDLLLTYNWGAIEWSMANLLVRLPEVHFEDGFGPDEAGGQLGRRIWTRRLVLRRARTVLPSKVLLSHAENLWRLPKERLAYIPNGIDCRRFQRSGEGAGRAEVVIGTVAALRPEKNLGRLLEAFALLPNREAVRLVIVGDGPERTGLEARAGSLGIKDRVTFSGHCDRPETALAGFYMFALSSDTEQMPISLVEAMAAGLPVAAVAVGDVADMVAEANRSLIVETDAAALSKAMAALIDDPERRASLGKANRARAEDLFDERLMIQRYTDLFQKAMDR